MKGAKNNIIDKAQRMNLLIPKPLSVSDLFDSQMGSYDFNKILVDEMPLVLDSLLSKLTHSNIDTATITLQEFSQLK